MGTLTVDRLLEEVVQGMGNRTDLTVTSPRVLEALNMAQEELTAVMNWEELQALLSFNLTASSPYVPYESIQVGFNPKDIYSFRIVDPSDRSNSRKLQMIPARTYDQIIADPEFWGDREPIAFIKWNDRFELFPVPDLAYPCELRCYLWPTPLTAGSGTSQLDKKDKILIHLALHYLMQIDAEEERATFHWTAVYARNGLLEKFMKEDQDEPDMDVVGVADPHGRRSGSANLGPYWKSPFIKGVR